MRIIPGINCPDFACLRQKLEAFRALDQSDGRWVHLDVAEPSFVGPGSYWNNPEDLADLSAWQLTDHLLVEAHLMLSDPVSVIDKWLNIPEIKRLVVHAEALTPAGFIYIQEAAASLGAEAMIALRPETSPEILRPYLQTLNLVQCLAVTPGRSGEPMNLAVLKKVGKIKTDHPQLTVEIDGGINPATLKKAIAAGADLAVSTSYIWQSAAPDRALEELNRISQ